MGRFVILSLQKFITAQINVKAAFGLLYGFRIMIMTETKLLRLSYFSENEVSI